jgi:hypothetical protein
MSVAKGSNRGFMATLNEFKGFSTIKEILGKFNSLPENEPMVWLLKTGNLQKPVLYLPSVSYAPYVRVTFVEGNAQAKELIFTPDQLFKTLDLLGSFDESKKSDRMQFARRSPFLSFANWLVNAKNKEK